MISFPIIFAVCALVCFFIASGDNSGLPIDSMMILNRQDQNFALAGFAFAALAIICLLF